MRKPRQQPHARPFPSPAVRLRPAGVPLAVACPPITVRMPERIGSYRIEARLGTGGMGEVYRARHERHGHRFALKKIRFEEAADPQRRERFRREAHAAMKLDHPAIVRVYGFVEEGGADWIVMELSEGSTLARSLAEGPFPWQHALVLAREITDGLAAAHAAGIIHRDLKTENVIVTVPPGRCTAGWHVKILDFGIAKQLGEASLTATDEILGTFRAISPEQAMGRRVDPRSDLFSLGVLCYEMLTGVSPFSTQHPVQTLVRVCTHRQAPVHELVDHLPRELSRLVDRLLEKDPNRRPHSAPEVLAALERLAIPFRCPTRRL